MIPRLYGSDIHSLSDLDNNIIGHMADCISATCRRVLNGVDEIEITYPMKGTRADDIALSNVIMAQPEYKKTAQPYRIYDVLRRSNGIIYIYARHIKEQLSYIPVRPFTLTGVTADAVFQEVQDRAQEDLSDFDFWTDIQTTNNFNLTAPASASNILGGMEGSILDIFGGEYEFDNWTIKLHSQRGRDNGVCLQYGKNIRSATKEESIDATITGIMPFWKDFEGNLVTLTEGVIYASNTQNFPFNRTVVKDFSDVFETQPTEAQLRTYAQNYISRTGTGIPETTLDVDFEHLVNYPEYAGFAINEQVNLGDTVTINYHDLDINASARVIGTQYDILNERYRRVNIGKIKYNLINVLKELK